MDRMERLARTSLLWDGGYCVVTGLAIAVASDPVAGALHLSRAAVVWAGIAAIVLGAAIGMWSRSSNWRIATVGVVFVNAMAVGGLITSVVVADLPAEGDAVLLVVAAQVFGFIAVEAHALWSPFGR